LEEDEMGVGGWDSGRWVAGLAGAVFQVGATVLAGAAISEVVDEGPQSPVEPAGYAFGVWAVIFSLVALRRLPGVARQPRERRFAARRLASGRRFSVHGPVVRLRVAETDRTRAGDAARHLRVLLVAYLRLARSDPGALSRTERWLVSLTVGIFLGWVTAANAVSLTSEVVRRGFVEAGGAGEVLVGSALLLFGGLLAAAITRAGRTGPPQAYRAFALTVLWALIAVVVAQYGASFVTTGTAVVAAVPVLVVLLRGGRTRPGARRAVRPRVA
jgi:hypothetical protein